MKNPASYAENMRFDHFPPPTTIFSSLSVFIDDFLASGRNELDQQPQLEFEQLPFSHPLFIMYSSGTTGAPKCMVHSAGVRNAATFLPVMMRSELTL